MPQPLDLSEQLINSTIQILSQKTVMQPNGIPNQHQITGTGFYFTFNTAKGLVLTIVTNRHVVEGAFGQKLNFKHLTHEGNPDYSNITQVELNGHTEQWIYHPNENVDLAILPIGTLLNHYEQIGKEISFITMDESHIPSDTVKNTLLAIEDILMVGYPFGLRDEANDLPIVRRGITATPFYLDFNKRKEFLCDVPVYPGSSGSPVLIMNQQYYTNRDGTITHGKRVYLLGINYATFTSNYEGKVMPIQAMLNDNIITTAIPYNIAIVIKSERILDFKPIILKRMGLH